jgi:hypothetical protein
MTLPVAYSGDPRFLPASLVATSAPDPPLAYNVSVTFRRSVPPGAAIVPRSLNLFGRPLYDARVTAVGALEVVRRDGAVLKRYRAKCVVSKSRTIFSSVSWTELRSRALQALGEAIDAQIRQDASFITSVAAQRELPGAP